MKKQKAKRRVKQEPKAGKNLNDPVTPPPLNEKNDPFDFGGMPDRNLKKNLGCG